MPPTPSVARTRPRIEPVACRGRSWLCAIAAFRVVKAVVLLVVAAGAFALVNHDIAALAERLIARLDLDRESQLVQKVLEHATGITPNALRAIGGGAIAYAALFLTEAYGLFRGRVWAEWLTIVATSSFIPIEVIESVRQFEAWKLGTFFLNVAIVAYLVHRRLQAHRRDAAPA